MIIKQLALVRFPCATGMIQQKDMEKVGIIMGIIGLILGYTMLIILGSNKLL